MVVPWVPKDFLQGRHPVQLGGRDVGLVLDRRALMQRDLSRSACYPQGNSPKPKVEEGLTDADLRAWPDVQAIDAGELHLVIEGGAKGQIGHTALVTQALTVSAVDFALGDVGPSRCLAS